MRNAIYIVLLHLFLVSVFLVSRLEPETIRKLGREDGLFESAGALAFLVASVCFMILYLRTPSGNDLILLRTRRNVFFLLLSLAFFVAGGEEISWGQRIFDWETPAALANSQGETTFHNLAVFQEQGLLKFGGFGGFYFMFNLFWMGFCVFLPLANRVRPFRDWIRRVGVPVPPLWVGTLLFSSWVTFKFAAANVDSAPGIRSALNEIKESNSAVAFAILGIFMVYQCLKTTSKSEDTGETADAAPAG